MAKPLTCRVLIKRAWWLDWYLAGVAMMSLATGRDPDWQKVERWVSRGIKLQLESTK